MSDVDCGRARSQLVDYHGVNDLPPFDCQATVGARRQHEESVRRHHAQESAADLPPGAVRPGNRLFRFPAEVDALVFGAWIESHVEGQLKRKNTGLTVRLVAGRWD